LGAVFGLAAAFGLAAVLGLGGAFGALAGALLVAAALAGAWACGLSLAVPVVARLALRRVGRRLGRLDRTSRSAGGMAFILAGAVKGKFCPRWAFEKKHPALQADVWPCRCWEDPKPETNEGVRRSTPQGPPRSSRRRTNCVTAVTRRC
jgi:hypothetical protein